MGAGLHSPFKSSSEMEVAWKHNLPFVYSAPSLPVDIANQFHAFSYGTSLNTKFQDDFESEIFNQEQARQAGRSKANTRTNTNHTLSLFAARSLNNTTPIHLGTVEHLRKRGMPACLLARVLHQDFSADDNHEVQRLLLSLCFKHGIGVHKDVNLAKSISQGMTDEAVRRAADFAVCLLASEPDTRLLEIVLAQWKNPNAIDAADEMPALSYSVTTNAVGAAKVLLEAGADLHLGEKEKKCVFDSPWERAHDEAFRCPDMLILFAYFEHERKKNTL